MRTIEEIAEFNAAVELLNMAAIKETVEGISPDRLREICEAERDGRCVVLPCKVGDTIYDASEVILGGCYSPDVYELDASEIGIKKFPSGEYVFIVDYCEYKASDFGKTVFLTREEVDAALTKQAPK